MRLVKRRKSKVRLVFEGKAVVATRAMRAENRHFPVIEVKMEFRQPVKDPRGELQIDEMVAYLDLEDATKLLGDLMHAVQAATPRIPRGAGTYQFGE